MGWVLQADDEIVGYLGNVALQYRLGDRTLTAAATHAWAVDPAHRNGSIALVQQFLRQPGVDLLLNTTANFEASRVFDALRVPRVPTDDYDVSLAWITNPVGLAGSALRHRGVPLSGVLRYPAAAALAVHGAGRGIRGSSPAGVRRLDMSDSDFDRRADAFWDRLGEDSSRLLAWRDSAALRWRFGHGAKTTIYVTEAKAEIQAWAVVRDDDNAGIGLRRRRIVDLRVTGNDRDAHVVQLLRAARADCRRDGVHVLEAVGFAGRTRACLESAAERRRRLPAWMFYYRATDPALAARLARPDAWDPCFFDGDGVL